MKLLTSFIAITAVALSASAFAQEESTPTGEPPASAVEETPATAPAEEKGPTSEEIMSPPTTMAPETKTETPAAKAPAPSPATKTASPATKEASPAPPPTPATGKKMGVEATLRDNENRWAAAAAKHDIASVEVMVADDFIGVNSKGKVQNRRALLGEMKSDKDTYMSTRNEKLDVRRYGNDVAVVVGTYREKGTGKDGKAFERTFRFTDTWVERNGTWKCVAGQSMLLKQK